MRLGEILIVADLVTPEQRDDALQAQVMLGARLGTRLVELGYLDLDTIANALSHQHKLPAALAHHFDRAEPALQRMLSADAAERFGAVPLFRVGARAAVVATMEPLDARTRAILADELGVTTSSLILAIAPELRIRYALEAGYNIRRPHRFRRPPGAPCAVPPRSVPRFESLSLEDLLEEQDLGAAPLPIPREPSRPRHYVHLLGAPPEDEVVDVDPEIVEELAEDDLLTSVDLISAGRDREEVASHAIAVLRHLLPQVQGVLLFTVRGPIIVTSASFRAAGGGKPMKPVALALDATAAPSVAVRSRSVIRVGSAFAEEDSRLLDALGVPGGHLVAVPVVSAGRAIAALVVASREPVDSGVVETVAGAAAAGFARLMREAVQ